MDEISLFEKIILNFNNNFINYTYFHNFNYMNKKLVDISNNNYLIEFLKTENFESQTQILMTIFKNIGKKLDKNNEEKKEKKQSITNINNQNLFRIVEKLNDKYFVNYLNDKTLNLSYYDEQQNNIIFCGKITLNENVYSISHSMIENKIFVSLLGQKKIKIIDYNLEQNILKLNNKQIFINDNNIFFNNNSPHFYICIQLTKELIATSDDQNIIIWKDYINNFIQIKNILLNSLTKNMLLIDNEHFICSQSEQKTLRIFGIKNFNQVKIINKIDCSDISNSLIKINDKFIIINCFKGIGLFYIKTKEIIQYIQVFSTIGKKQKICYDNKDNLYIINLEINNNNTVSNSISLFSSNTFYNVNNNIRIVKAKIINGSLEKIKEYENFNSVEDINNVIYYPEDSLILFGANRYNYLISL